MTPEPVLFESRFGLWFLNLIHTINTTLLIVYPITWFSSADSTTLKDGDTWAIAFAIINMSFIAVFELIKGIFVFVEISSSSRYHGPPVLTMINFFTFIDLSTFNKTEWWTAKVEESFSIIPQLDFIIENLISLILIFARVDFSPLAIIVLIFNIFDLAHIYFIYKMAMNT